jgi:hypothetical protein
MFKKRFYEPTNTSNIVFKNRQILSKPFYNIADNEGLRRAYNQPNRIYVNGDRMYVAGTTWTDDRNISKPPLYTMLLKGLFPQTIPDNFSLNDAIDDLKIPMFKTQDIQRYKDAEQVLKDNPNIKTLVGHSMGSSVILELNKANNDKFTTRTYSAPVFDPFPNNWEKNDANNQRFRTKGDPVAIFDNNAETVYKQTLDPLSLHSYNNFGNIGEGISKTTPTQDTKITISK